MATRILPLALLTLALGASACALQPLDPGEDPAGDQSSALTSTDVPDLPGAATRPNGTLAPQLATAGRRPSGLPGDSLRTGENPNKPQPDPWNPGSSDPVDDPSQQSTNSPAGTLPSK
jgi:hypothetical protein